METTSITLIVFALTTFNMADKSDNTALNKGVVFVESEIFSLRQVIGLLLLILRSKNSTYNYYN